MREHRHCIPTKYDKQMSAKTEAQAAFGPHREDLAFAPVIQTKKSQNIQRAPYEQQETSPE